MFESFIPLSAQRLQDADAIALLHRLYRKPITVPDFRTVNTSTTIPTAVVTPDQAARTTASSTPLLLLHGFDSSLLEFRHLIPYLLPHWPVYALDLLGFGFTAHLPSVSIDPHTIRQHLYCTWKTLLNRPVTLLGASMGGAVAIDFALAYPDCVERLILIDSVGFSGSFPLGKLLGSPLLDWGADWLHFRKDIAFRTLELLPFVSPAQQDVVLASSLHQEMPGWKQAVMSFTRSGGYSDLFKQIPAVRQQTLILWGEQDQTLGTQDAQKFEQAIPHSRLAWIKGAEHAPHLYNPAAVAGEISRELSR